MSSPILEVKNLEKLYPGQLKAVNGVSFAIEKGVCFGLLGPNGAGKTTTIEMIEDILSLSGGEVLYKGKARDRRFQEEVGIQFQSTELPHFLTVYETLRMFHRLYRRRRPLDELIEICQLQAILKRDNRKISGGQRQRLLLALALLNQPELVFLDEPTTGMDPQARRNLWAIVENIKAQGTTLVLTTHYMDEAQILCDRIAIMDRGEILTEGTPRELIQRYCPGVQVLLPLSVNKEALKALSWPVETRADAHVIQTQDVKACLQALMEQKLDMSAMGVHSPTLEDVFLTLTGRSLRE